MVETVCRMVEGHTKQEVKRAVAACHLQAMLGSPSQSDFEGMACSNMIVDTNLNVEDCKRTSNSFGKKLTDMRYKTIQVKPDQVEPEYVATPKEMIESNRNVTLNVDIMFVNRLPFLVIHGRKVDQ